MVKIAVFGDYESIKGYSSIGLNIFPCEKSKDEEALFKSLLTGEYGIVYITEEYAALFAEEIEKYDDKLLPAIIPIPALKNNNGFGIHRLKASVEKAVGSDIIFNK